MLETRLDNADFRDAGAALLFVIEAVRQAVGRQRRHDDLGAPGCALGAEGAFEAVGVAYAAAHGDGVALVCVSCGIFRMCAVCRGWNGGAGPGKELVAYLLDDPVDLAVYPLLLVIRVDDDLFAYVAAWVVLLAAHDAVTGAAAARRVDQVVRSDLLDAVHDQAMAYRELA